MMNGGVTGSMRDKARKARQGVGLGGLTSNSRIASAEAAR